MMSGSTFVKTFSADGAAEAEAAGLRWLREASDCVAEVVRVEAYQLETVRYSESHPTADVFYRAGRELARIHTMGEFEAFGVKPAPGGIPFQGQIFIGTQKQDCDPCPHFGEFYARQRVLPFAHKAFRRGSVSGECLDLVDRACALIAAHRWVQGPCRIHGDLWTGNLLHTADGPVFIDPAAHTGHPETDIAMLALFGVSYFSEVIHGYESVVPLAHDWEERIGLHQLHPLAVHALTHGPLYGRALEEAARDTLRAFDSGAVDGV